MATGNRRSSSAWLRRRGLECISSRYESAISRRAPLTRLVERCVEAVRGTRARVLVNDRVDVALAAGAHGVHLRGDSMPAARARIVAPPAFLVGRSVHSPEEALRAQAGRRARLSRVRHRVRHRFEARCGGVGPRRARAGRGGNPSSGAGDRRDECGDDPGRRGAPAPPGSPRSASSPTSRPDQLQVSVQQASLAFDTLGGVP